MALPPPKPMENMNISFKMPLFKAVFLHFLKATANIMIKLG